MARAELASDLCIVARASVDDGGTIFPLHLEHSTVWPVIDASLRLSKACHRPAT
jgi:hypothetical protein